MTTGYKYNNADLLGIFGAKGASTAAATGYKTNNVDLNQQLLALADGVDIGFNTNYKVNNTDLRYIFGAPTPALPINGGTYQGDLTLAGNIYTSKLSFNVSTSGWSLVGQTTESGSIPAGATQVSVAVTQTTGTTTLAITQIGKTALSASVMTASMQAGRSSGSPSTGDEATFVVTFYNASGTAISTTTFTGISQA